MTSSLRQTTAASSSPETIWQITSDTGSDATGYSTIEYMFDSVVV